MPKPSVALMQQLAKTRLRTLTAGKQNAHKAEAYVDAACEAIVFAWDMWRIAAKFSNLRINGPIALGTPGCLDGPKWEDNIKARAPKSDKWETMLSRAVAAGFSEAWKSFQSSVTVPGLPWYPSFAAWPGPMAPPTPNIPTPLISLGVNPGLLTVPVLKTKVLNHAGTAVQFSEEIADALASGFVNVFTIWLASQQITNVMGKGPVPTFAPPYVPVGPVVGGDNIAVPGHLAT